MDRKHLPISYDCTRLEVAALRRIAESEYHDCASTDCAIVGNPVWSGYDYLGGGELTSRNIAGVLSSLAQKHLATFGESDGMPTVALTEHGWLCYKAHFHPEGTIPVAMLPALTAATLAELVGAMSLAREQAHTAGQSARVAMLDKDLAALRAEQEQRIAVGRAILQAQAVPL